MKKSIIIVLSCWICLLFPLHSFAADSVPYITETESANGTLIETQTAYKPINLFAPNTITSPEDIFIDHSNNVYVADSGLKKVVEFDPNGKALHSYGGNILEDPTGVFVDQKGDVYVADNGKDMVYRFSQSGKLLAQYGRPSSPLFGKQSPYKPQKVAVDRRGNIYVIGEGSINGIIQLSRDGSFLGYFGVNSTQNSISSILMNLITTQQQKNGMFLKTPPAPSNIAIDDKGLVYSITSGTDTGVIKKMNIAGGDLIPSSISSDRTLVGDRKSVV
jgi:hypothetical protein